MATAMKLRTLARVAATAVLLCMAAPFAARGIHAQVVDLSKIDAFESMGTGRLHGAAPPKTIIDDGERHIVILTIWEADADTKVYWKPPDAEAQRTTVIPGRGIQTFQTAGEFKLEAIGEPSRKVEFGYVLLGLRK